jgi:hypothetical protein
LRVCEGVQKCGIMGGMCRRFPIPWAVINLQEAYPFFLAMFLYLSRVEDLYTRRLLRFP